MTKKVALVPEVTNSRRLLSIILLVILVCPSQGFLPKRTSRWWDKTAGDLGPPISEEEKIESLKLKPPPLTPYGKHQLESSRLYEGDIIWSQSLNLPTSQDGNRRMLKGLHTWPDASVAYTIENTFTKEERLHVARALTEIETKSCIRFHPRSDEVNFVYFHKGKDCASNVGRIGGGQPLSLAPKCVQFGVILHEVLHSLGFWHEQSRYDRRNYVDIHWFNIKPLMLPNFLVSPYYFMSDVGLPYDYDSIMHYTSNSFARNPNKPTITPKQEGITIGQRRGLSKMNAEGLNMLYECEGKLPVASNDAYRDGRALGGPENGCADLWSFCEPTRYMGSCWWGDYLMRRYCRKTCGQCS